jgi:tight adherence protein B
MTVALVVTALGLASWPRPANGHRVRALRAQHRLAPVSSPAQRRSLHLGRPRAAVVVGGAAVVAAAVIAPSQGGLAAGEFAVALLAISAAVVTAGRRTVATRRRGARDAEVALALAIVVGELAAGAPAAAALRAAGAVGAEIERRLGEVGGADDSIARVVAAWRVSSVSGMPLVDVLSRARTDLADSTAGRREVGAAVAGPQASAIVLALLPLLGVALGTAMGASPVMVLFTTAIGRVLLCLGVVLDALGVVWTARLIAAAQS